MLSAGWGVNFPSPALGRDRKRGPSKSKTIPAFFLSFLLYALLSPTLSYATVWHQYYAEAEAALRNQDWSTAVEKINLALETKGDSSARARTYGMTFIEYFPYFKLGIAYFHLGRLEAAWQAFDTEVKLGAITQSTAQLTELRRYQGLIEAANDEAAAEEERRIEEIVATNLRSASRYEGSGEFERAMGAIGNVLAVRPGHPAATAAMSRLQEALSRLLAERELDEEVQRLVEEGKRALQAQDHEHAISSFDRALALRPTDELRAMRKKASNLRSETRAREGAASRAAEDDSRKTQWIADTLRQVRSLEGTGDLVEALKTLRSVLVMDPSNRSALDLQVRLTQALAEADKQRVRQRTLQTMERQLQSQFDLRDYETALHTANRILALDPSNGLARGLITRAYRAISRELLGMTIQENFPPAIRFADFRRSQLDDGLQVELVNAPDFRLTGSIFDNAPVELSFELIQSDHAGQAIPGESHVQQIDDNFLSLFSVTHRLAPGLSVFKIAAVDPEGQASSSDYAVLYLVPWYRSQWVYSLVAVALATVLLGFYGHRVRERNRLRRRQFNPYIAGAPVLDENLFFGRKDLVDRILQTVHNNSLLLFGERRIGKTSLQHHLKKRLQELRDQEYEFHPVYIDLQGTPQERFFATLADDILEELGPHLAGMEMSEPTPDDPEYSYRDLVRDLRQVLRTLRERTTRKIKLVLLIDEVDELNAYDPRINQRLRSLFMKSFADHLVAVVSGVGIKKQWDSHTSPWYNFFEEIEVKPFAAEDAERLIREPISDMFKIEKGVVERIIELTECKPYLIQKLCINLVNRLHAEKSQTMTLRHVEEIGRPGEV